MARYITPYGLNIVIQEAIGRVPRGSCSHQELCEYFNRRLDFCLEAAHSTMIMANRLLNEYGDESHACRLVEEAREFMAEADHIDSMRTHPLWT